MTYKVLLPFYIATIVIDDIADRFEDVERYTDGKKQTRHVDSIRDPQIQ